MLRRSKPRLPSCEGETLTLSFNVVAIDNSGARKNTLPRRSKPSPSPSPLAANDRAGSSAITRTQAPPLKADGAAHTHRHRTNHLGRPRCQRRRHHHSHLQRRPRMVRWLQRRRSQLPSSRPPTTRRSDLHRANGLSPLPPRSASDQNGWQYSAAQNLDFLREGETLTLSFNVVAIDNSGAGNDTLRAGRNRHHHPHWHQRPSRISPPSHRRRRRH